MNQLFCIGNYSPKGISLLNFKKGNFSPFGNLLSFPNCSYLIKNKDFLYLISETSTGKIISFHKDNFLFMPLNYSYTHGKSPCHLTIDPIRNMSYVANYEDGSFSAFQINTDGAIGSNLYFEKFEKNISHIHFVKLSQDNTHLFVIDLGTSKIHAYTIHSNPSFDLELCSTFSFPKDSQPRHLVLDLNNRIHVITEKSCEIYTLCFQDNTFSYLFKTSIIPDSLHQSPNDTGCAIKISKNNRFLYTSVRGKNLICVFEIFENKLNLIQSISCYGSIPRDISFDKTENYLICANQGSNNLTTFKVSSKFRKIIF